eukprot:gene2658-33846_t
MRRGGGSHGGGSAGACNAEANKSTTGATAMAAGREPVTIHWTDGNNKTIVKGPGSVKWRHDDGSIHIVKDTSRKKWSSSNENEDGHSAANGSMHITVRPPPPPILDPQLQPFSHRMKLWYQDVLLQGTEDSSSSSSSSGTSAAAAAARVAATSLEKMRETYPDVGALSALSDRGSGFCAIRYDDTGEVVTQNLINDKWEWERAGSTPRDTTRYTNTTTTFHAAMKDGNAEGWRGNGITKATSTQGWGKKHGIYNCDHCDRSFGNPQNYKSHVAARHGAEAGKRAAAKASTIASNTSAGYEGAEGAVGARGTTNIPEASSAEIPRRERYIGSTLVPHKGPLTRGTEGMTWHKESQKWIPSVAALQPDATAATSKVATKPKKPPPPSTLTKKSLKRKHTQHRPESQLEALRRAGKAPQIICPQDAFVCGQKSFTRVSDLRRHLLMVHDLSEAEVRSISAHAAAVADNATSDAAVETYIKARATAKAEAGKRKSTRKVPKSVAKDSNTKSSSRFHGFECPRINCGKRFTYKQENQGILDEHLTTCTFPRDSKFLSLKVTYSASAATETGVTPQSVLPGPSPTTLKRTVKTKLQELETLKMLEALQDPSSNESSNGSSSSSGSDHDDSSGDNKSSDDDDGDGDSSSFQTLATSLKVKISLNALSPQKAKAIEPLLNSASKPLEPDANAAGVERSILPKSSPSKSSGVALLAAAAAAAAAAAVSVPGATRPKCSNCGTTFNRMGNLRRHQMKVDCQNRKPNTHHEANAINNGESAQVNRGGDGQVDRGGDGQVNRGGDGQVNRGGDGQVNRGDDGQVNRGGDGQVNRGGDGQAPTSGSSTAFHTSAEYNKFESAPLPTAHAQTEPTPASNEDWVELKPIVTTAGVHDGSTLVVEKNREDAPDADVPDDAAISVIEEKKGREQPKMKLVSESGEVGLPSSKEGGAAVAADTGAFASNTGSVVTKKPETKQPRASFNKRKKQSWERRRENMDHLWASSVSKRKEKSPRRTKNSSDFLGESEARSPTVAPSAEALPARGPASLLHLPPCKLLGPGDKAEGELSPNDTSNHKDKKRVTMVKTSTDGTGQDERKTFVSLRTAMTFLGIQGHSTFYKCAREQLPFNGWLLNVMAAETPRKRTRKDQNVARSANFNAGVATDDANRVSQAAAEAVLAVVAAHETVESGAANAGLAAKPIVKPAETHTCESSAASGANGMSTSDVVLAASVPVSAPANRSEEPPAASDKLGVSEVPDSKR